MTLSAYNGFTHKERMEALAWVRSEVKAGRRVPPAVCQVCGQTEAINEHSEDYSQPFGDHIGAFSLCQCCHLMVHFRFQQRERWETYRDLIRSGARLAPVGTFREFMKVMIGQPPQFWRHEYVRPQAEQTWLDTLSGQKRILSQTGQHKLIAEQPAGPRL